MGAAVVNQARDSRDLGPEALPSSRLRAPLASAGRPSSFMRQQLSLLSWRG